MNNGGHGTDVGKLALYYLVLLIKASTDVEGVNIIIEAARSAQEQQMEFDLDIIRAWRDENPHSADTCDLLIGNIIAKKNGIVEERKRLDGK